MPEWSKLYDRCSGCGTITRDYDARGCCWLCLPVWRRKVHAERWDPMKPGPWKSWPERHFLCDRQDASPAVLSVHKLNSFGAR